MRSASRVCLNGIDATTGDYLVSPFEREDLVQRVVVDPHQRSWLARVADQARESTWGLPYDRNPAVVKEAGWGVVFHEAEEPAVRAALAPLIAHRRARIDNDRIVKELVYRTGEDRAGWLARHKVAPPTVDPERVPYYLLLVGDPSRVPFPFAHQLSVEYAVGRLHFDSVDGYERYVQSVISYETAPAIDRQKTVTVFGTLQDEATQLSADSLLVPLARGAQGKPSVMSRHGFEVREHIGAPATKEMLTEIVSAGEGGPAVLFTATHGIGWPRAHPQQERNQGALLCQNWTGGPLAPSQYFSAADLEASGRVHGLIAFHFACFSAGTPREDRFPWAKTTPAQPLADRPFLSALAKALLSHREGGALACVGHVERAWGYSIESADAGPQLLPFENFLGKVLTGCPLGFAMRDFGEKYATVSTLLSALLEKSESQEIDDAKVAELWMERNDAEAYLIVGDPAVRLRLDAMNAQGGPRA